MSIELSILGLSANQIAALRATPALTDDVTTVASADRFWAGRLASIQDDELKERREKGHVRAWHRRVRRVCCTPGYRTKLLRCRGLLPGATS